jgi:hypothetical protein
MKSGVGMTTITNEQAALEILADTAERRACERASTAIVAVRHNTYLVIGALVNARASLTESERAFFVNMILAIRDDLDHAESLIDR